MLVPVLGWILFGLIVGALARLAYPGRQDIGFFKTILVGIAGSFVGGFIGWLLFGLGGSALQASGWIGSIVGAVIVLAVLMRQQRATS